MEKHFLYNGVEYTVRRATVRDRLVIERITSDLGKPDAVDARDARWWNNQYAQFVRLVSCDTEQSFLPSSDASIEQLRAGRDAWLDEGEDIILVWREATNDLRTALNPAAKNEVGAPSESGNGN